MFAQSVRQGDMGRCDQSGLGRAGKWTSVSPWCLVFSSFEKSLLSLSKFLHSHNFQTRVIGRGLHSSTSHLNPSRF